MSSLILEERDLPENIILEEIINFTRKLIRNSGMSAKDAFNACGGLGVIGRKIDTFVKGATQTRKTLSTVFVRNVRDTLLAEEAFLGKKEASQT